MSYTGDVLASSLSNPDRFFTEWTGRNKSDAGVPVTPNSALGHVPFWQAVNVIAGDVGQLPWHKMIKLDGGGAARDEEHPREWLIAHQPNRIQTPSVWREMMMHWALVWGNGISGLVRVGGELELLPFLPDRTKCVASDDEFGYTIVTRLADDREVAVPPSQAFHIRGLTSNGYWGLSAVETLRNAIGHGLALQKHGNSTFANGAQVGGVLSSPGAQPKPEVLATMREQWNRLHAGTESAGRVAFLFGGATFTPIAMNNDDAQYLESRKFDVATIASIFNLPAFKLNELTNSSTRANLEEQNRDYFNTSLSRWLNRFNEEACRKLLSEAERRTKKHFFRWSPEAFLRGDIQKRYAAYSQAITARIMNPNEVRSLEDLNPYEGGDEYLNPAIDKAGSQSSPQDAPSESGDGQSQEMARALIRSQTKALLEAEANIVRKSAESARNYLAWADNYYENYQKTAENFLDLPCKIAIQSGILGADWRAACCEHARTSLNRLNAMAGLVTKSSLPQVGAEMGEAIRGDLERFVTAILGEIAND